MSVYRVRLWQGSFVVEADNEAEARDAALQTVFESPDWFELAVEDEPGLADASKVRGTEETSA